MKTTKKRTKTSSKQFKVEAMKQLEQYRDSLLQAKNIEVHKLIQIHMVFDGVGTTGWVHTHGMWETFQLPDLEIVGVSPLFLMTAAGGMLNHIAQYMVDGKLGAAGAKPVVVGQAMGMGHGVFVKFGPSSPLNPKDQDEIDGHFASPRWRVMPLMEQFKCAGCADHDKHDQEMKQ